MKAATTVLNYDTAFKCKYCGSPRLEKKGIRKNKSGSVQRLSCKVCHKSFSANIGFRYRRYSKDTITGALSVYFSGMSVRRVAEHYATRGINIDPSAIYRWVQRYSRVAAKFMDSLTPDTGNKFRADEVWVNVEGEKHYLFASMDDYTRYWLAFDLADKKHGHRAERLSNMTKNQASKYPKEFITDGLKSYKTAARSELGDHTKHVSEIHITGFKVGKDNNNKMERLNGTIRDREKTFRSLGTKYTTNFHGLRVHYNHARKHGALKMTPGEAAGIRIDGNDKWATMIQNGSMFLIKTDQRV